MEGDKEQIYIQNISVQQAELVYYFNNIQHSLAKGTLTLQSNYIQIQNKSTFYIPYSKLTSVGASKGNLLLLMGDEQDEQQQYKLPEAIQYILQNNSKQLQFQCVADGQYKLVLPQSTPKNIADQLYRIISDNIGVEQGEEDEQEEFEMGGMIGANDIDEQGNIK